MQTSAYDTGRVYYTVAYSRLSVLHVLTGEGVWQTRFSVLHVLTGEGVWQTRLSVLHVLTREGV